MTLETPQPLYLFTPTLYYPLYSFSVDLQYYNIKINGL